jgi:excisionase family DNA binding protein
MTKISADHLARSAVVYVRQSSVDQVAHNLESKRRQYGLEARARELGWSDVEVIDDDLGKSGGGVARRGFERLLALICEGRVGAVFSIEASRLARNGRDWHTLLEFCGLVGTLIVDEEGVYDSRSINDRLLLGMKGTMSEMELSVIRQRSVEAVKQKARRGEHFTTVAVGYVKTNDDRIEKNPDVRVREALDLVFRKFVELQSIRQVLLWLIQEKIALPVAVRSSNDPKIEWRTPSYTTVYHILINPIYAGAYAYGRRGVRTTIENGRKKMKRTPQRDWKAWEVLLRDRHESYISWDDFIRNQRLIADNANGKSYLGRGAVRRGEALLPGLLRCGRCGRRLFVQYSGKGGNTQRYVCRGEFTRTAAVACLGFGGMRIDRMVAREVLERLQPLGVEAALNAMKAQDVEQSEKLLQLQRSLEHAQYEASRAYRQYDAVDPDNRHVAGELERRWNERIDAVRAIEREIEGLTSSPSPGLSAGDREALLKLGDDLVRAWQRPGVTSETKKKILRTVLSEIVVDVGQNNEHLDLIIHWQGGDHTRLKIKKNRVGVTRWTTDAEVVDLVRVLARQMPDYAIAAVLNRSGKTTAHGASWTRTRVCSLRSTREIEPYREGERKDRGELSLDEAAEMLDVSPSTIRRMIVEGRLPAKQLCKGSTWIIKQTDLTRLDVTQDASRRRSRRRPPPSESNQKCLEF